MTDGLVATEQGRVQGLRDGGVWCWRGLPYAKPPVGALRFRLPEAPAPWTGVRDASRFGTASAQRMTALGGGRSRLGSRLGEDCLNLNIWSPGSGDRRRPVMVWLHGGGFVGGSGALYGGAPLAKLGDVVVVTINYRLGVFGFVNFGDALGDHRIGGNLGLHDAIAALRWVRTHIAAFGGDPDRVTIAGESAGSILVSLLMLADTAKPLFHGAIMQSGAINLVHARDTARLVAEAYLEQLAIAPPGLEALQSVPTERLLDAQAAVGRRLKGISPAAPWFDGVLVPPSFAAAQAKPTPSIPLLAGANRDEIVLFKVMPGADILPLRRNALVELVDRDLDKVSASRIRGVYPDTPDGNRALGSDANFVMPTLHVAERHAAAGAPTWVYRFDYAHPVLRACHALELFFLWPFPGLLAAALRGGFLIGLRSGLSERMRAAWANFVRTGSPGDDWPPFALPTRSTRLFALQDRIVSDPMRERRNAWNGNDVEVGR